ncbi:MAG: DNA-processing protein DprA, partial [Candidatus Rokubacteria bacterium]|nr:DNA-processing protein DprA [Candidatus Rokubacteria bacterium]
HRGALAVGGRTLAVLGNGIDVVYPPENRRLAAAVEHQGALLTQFEPGTPPLPYHFPTRNRTLAGLSLGVIVVEATEKSGALITAGFAGDLGREVFAVPGKITASASAGPHGLLRDGAILVRTWQDVVQDLPEPWRSTIVPGRVVATANEPPESGDRDRGILALLADGEPQHIEQLIARSQHEAGAVSAALVALELDGWVRPLEGQRWVAVRRRR